MFAFASTERRGNHSRRGQMAFQYRGLRVSARAAEKYWKTVRFCAGHVRLVSYNFLIAHSITGRYKRRARETRSGEAIRRYSAWERVDVFFFLSQILREKEKSAIDISSLNLDFAYREKEETCTQLRNFKPEIASSISISTIVTQFTKDDFNRARSKDVDRDLWRNSTDAASTHFPFPPPSSFFSLPAFIPPLILPPSLKMMVGKDVKYCSDFTMVHPFTKGRKSGARSRCNN